MNASHESPVVMRLRAVGKRFVRARAQPYAVLDGIDLTLEEGAIIGLLGRSGCGKSTLLRIAAGLLPPSCGAVEYRGRPLTGPSEGIAVVFQTFALYPWLNVRQNVELGLDAMKLGAREIARRTSAAIELIGLDGFESAFPRELSGGMRQRVGFARAIVSDPILLLMDEPFSALDVLTAETLRTDFLDLWSERQLPTRSALLVTHNIEEAVLMCDRLVVLGSQPGHVIAQLPITPPRPRCRSSPAFQAVVSEIYAIIADRMTRSMEGSSERIWRALPAVSVSEMSGLLETLAGEPYHGEAEIAPLARALNLPLTALLSVAGALHLLEFAELSSKTLKSTAAGRTFALAGPDDRKRLFREHLLTFVPFAAHIRQVLAERDDHRAPRERFEFEIEDHLNPSDAGQALRAVIGWGRYAEIFTYDDAVRSFALAD